MNKILGVIGGMGPVSTIDFYKRVVEHTKADTDQEHIDMIILNHASTIDRTEALLSEKKEELISSLIKDAKKLESMGASIIAMPCNTVHAIIDEIKQSVNIPVIDMIEETVNSIDGKIGIMATLGTINTKLYQKKLDEKNIEYLVPETYIQDIINEMIYNDAKEKNVYDINKLNKVVDYFKNNGCDKILLGCTELSHFKGHSNNLIDPMDYLVKASITKMGKEYILEDTKEAKFI